MGSNRAKSTNGTNGTKVVLALIAIPVIVLGFMLVNQMNGDGSMGGMDHGASGGTSSSSYKGSDLAFAQMMIPHHEQAVEMANLALEKSTNEDVRSLATRIKNEQTPEIKKMKGWISSSDSSMDGPMKTDDPESEMGGMISDDEMKALMNATPENFDSLFLKGMIAHHQGAVRMTKMIRGSKNPKVRLFAKAIVTAQSGEIAEMKELLKTP